MERIETCFLIFRGCLVQNNRSVSHCFSEGFVWLLTHDKLQGRTVDDVIVSDVSLFVRLAIQEYLLDIDIFLAVVFCFNSKSELLQVP
jgi:hypothetical protein